LKSSAVMSFTLSSAPYIDGTAMITSGREHASLGLLGRRGPGVAAATPGSFRVGNAPNVLGLDRL
jgi:hypothetical protein